ncbi:MAG: lytic transglycosylase domain-containing protein [Candidatus Xenobia bacterium]
MRLWLCLFVMALLLPAHASDFVDPALSHARLLALLSSGDVHVQGQMVLWQGWLTSQTLQPDGSTDIMLRTGDGAQIPVHYRKGCKNLQVDRRGTRVAAKATIQLDLAGRFLGLQGRSLILLEPGTPMGFRQFESSHKLPADPIADLIAWRFWFHHPEYSDRELAKWAAETVESAQADGVDPLLLAALMQIESAYDIKAVSHSGAVGLGQLMTFTASRLGVDPWDPSQNIDGAAKYLGNLLQRFASWKDPIVPSLAAYNAGPNAVEYYKAVPPVPETTNYVIFVRLVWKELHAEANRYALKDGS